MPTLHEKINVAVVSVAHRRNAALTEVVPEQTLGFDSSDIAQPVAVLEIETGLDPFAATAIGTMQTIADLCDAYARAS